MDAIREGLQNMEKDAAERLKQSAKEQGQPLTIDFFSRNYPLEADSSKEPMWDIYGKNGLKEAMDCFFYPTAIPRARTRPPMQLTYNQREDD